MQTRYIEYFPCEKFSYLTRIYAVGEYAISIASELWADNIVEERWYTDAGETIQIRDSIRECVGILCGGGKEIGSAQAALKTAVELASAADTNNMPVCVLLLDGPVGHAALEKLGAVSDVYPLIYHALGDCPGLAAKAQVIYDVVEDFGKANNWISYAAHKKGRLKRSEELLELADIWRAETDKDFRI